MVTVVNFYYCYHSVSWILRLNVWATTILWAHFYLVHFLFILLIFWVFPNLFLLRNFNRVPHDMVTLNIKSYHFHFRTEILYCYKHNVNIWFAWHLACDTSPQCFMDQRLRNTALIALAKTSSAILNKSGESRHPCFIPEFSGNVLSFYPLRIILVISWPFVACILI